MPASIKDAQMVSLIFRFSADRMDLQAIPGTICPQPKMLLATIALKYRIFQDRVTVKYMVRDNAHRSRTVRIATIPSNHDMT
jgi:hypothetical protein